MHDPLTVAFDIKKPWFRYRPWPKACSQWSDLTDAQKSRRSPHWRDGYRETMVTIWHVDPETDGSDDYCSRGWSRSRTEREESMLRQMASWEREHPYLTAHPARLLDPKYPSLWSVGPGDCFVLLVEMWRQFAWRMERRRLTRREIDAALMLSCSDVGNLQRIFVADTARRDEEIDAMFRCAFRCWKDTNGKFWQRHWRWHFWHWRIQVPALQAVRRVLLSRCCKCGGGFRYGESVFSGQWHSERTPWFRGEKDLMHSGCAGVGMAKEPTNG